MGLIHGHCCSAVFNFEIFKYRKINIGEGFINGGPQLYIYGNLRNVRMFTCNIEIFVLKPRVVDNKVNH